MSQESDGASPTPEDKKLDQLIRGSSNVELSGALLLEPIELIPRVSHDQHRIEQQTVRDLESDPLSIGEISSDEQVSQEAVESIHDVLHELPIPSSNVKPPSARSASIKRKWTDNCIVFSPEAETPKQEIDNFSDVSREKIEFKLADQNVVVNIKNVEDGTLICEGIYRFVKKLKFNHNRDIPIAAKCVKVTEKTNKLKLRKELGILRRIAQNQQSLYIIDFYGALWNPNGGELCFLMKLMQINLQEAYTKLHTMRPLKKGNLDLLLRRVAYNIISALKCMQIHDLSHNDIKPANILLDRQGHLKLADFGESDKLVDGKVPRTPHPGTCYYWAPEYTESNGTCSSERSNLWALALTLLETSIGKHPYPSDMSEFQRDSYIKTWTPKVPLDKISQESADFILHLFERRSAAKITTYDNILQLPYLASVTGDPLPEEIILFKLITS